MENKLLNYMAKMASGEFTDDILYFCPSDGMLRIAKIKELKPTNDARPIDDLYGGTTASFYKKCHDESKLKKQK